MINFPLSSFCHKKNPSPLYFWIEGLIIPGNSLSKFVAWNRLSLEGFFVDVKNRRLVLFLPEYLENWGRKSQEIAHVIHQTISIHLVTYICCRAELTLSYFKGLIFFFANSIDYTLVYRNFQERRSQYLSAKVLVSIKFCCQKWPAALLANSHRTEKILQ